MLAAGIETAAELGKRCGVSRRTAHEWLHLEKARLSSLHLFALSDLLGVRLRWLLANQPPAMRHPPQAAEALSILDDLPANKVAEWLRVGHRLAGHRNSKT